MNPTPSKPLGPIHCGTNLRRYKQSSQTPVRALNDSTPQASVGYASGAALTSAAPYISYDAPEFDRLY